MGGQRGLDEVGQLEQQCVLALQVLGQQRLVVCHPVAELVQLAGADVDVGSGGAGGGRVVQVGAPQRDVVCAGAEVAPESEHQLRDDLAGCGLAPAGLADRPVQVLAGLGVDIDLNCDPPPLRSVPSSLRSQAKTNAWEPHRIQCPPGRRRRGSGANPPARRHLQRSFARLG